LLANAGFEQTSHGEVTGWQHHGGLLSQVAEPVRGGSFAGALFSSTSSTKWAYQTVSVTPLQWYDLTAFVCHDHPGVESAWLRISWYESPDASGSAIDTVDSLASLDAPSPDYHELRTGPVQAPPGVHAAAVRIMLRPRSDLSSLIYIDDVSFDSVTPPAAPADETVDVDPPPGPPGGDEGPAQGRASNPAPVSEVLGAVAMRAPQPTPMVVRHPDALLVPEHSVSSGDAFADRKWLWVIAAGLLAAGASATAAYWRSWPVSATVASPPATAYNRPEVAER
jgi:hypothetical protein